MVSLGHGLSIWYVADLDVIHATSPPRGGADPTIAMRFSRNVNSRVTIPASCDREPRIVPYQR